MAARSEQPSFNLKAAVQKTGVKAETLRAWERRYGLPMPGRSRGGHRLYSHRDIDTIRWLVARQAEGLSIKQAVETWRQIESEGRDPLRPSPPSPALPAAPLGGGTIAQLREDWIGACLAFDEGRSEQLLTEAFALYPPEVVALELLQKAVAQIGEEWYQGSATVQQEHFCSALAIRRVEALLMATPPPVRPDRILVASPPEEQHSFSLLLFTLLLRRRGWDVVYLGANVPTDRLESTIATTTPRLVVSAAQQLHTAATLWEMALSLREESIPLAYGGLIFNRLPELRDRIPGHFLGEKLAEAVPAVENMIAAPAPPPVSIEPPTDYVEAREHYLERQGLIENHLRQGVSLGDIPPRFLAMASRELAQRIQAGLRLGAVSFVNADMHWLEGLLRNHHLPAEFLRRYLRAYSQATRAYLDARGAMVVTWLGNLVERTEQQAAAR